MRIQSVRAGIILRRTTKKAKGWAGSKKTEIFKRQCDVMKRHSTSGYSQYCCRAWRDRATWWRKASNRTTKTTTSPANDHDAMGGSTVVLCINIHIAVRIITTCLLRLLLLLLLLLLLFHCRRRHVQRLLILQRRRRRRRRWHLYFGATNGALLDRRPSHCCPL